MSVYACACVHMCVHVSMYEYVCEYECECVHVGVRDLVRLKDRGVDFNDHFLQVASSLFGGQVAWWPDLGGDCACFRLYHAPRAPRTLGVALGVT